jgi:hypothetical protein
MLFLNSDEIKVFKLERKSMLNNESTDGLSFILLETIQICDIITIVTRKQTKNIVTIQFTSINYGKTNMVIDLITDNDSKSFITKTKQYIEKFEKNKVL